MNAYIPTNDEKYELELYKRQENSKYEYEDNPSCIFRGRPANTLEKKLYRIQKGVNGSSDSIFVYCSNLPQDLKIEDQVKYMGKFYTVQSIGYYFDAARFVNPRCLSEEQIIARCPKGLNLQ